MRAVRTLMRIVGRPSSAWPGSPGPPQSPAASPSSGRWQGEIDALLAAGRPAASGTVREGDLQGVLRAG
jgi:hypothetical protein